MLMKGEPLLTFDASPSVLKVSSASAMIKVH